MRWTPEKYAWSRNPIFKGLRITNVGGPQAPFHILIVVLTGRQR